MHDIENEAHVKKLIDTFYDKVRKDAVIGHIFNEIIGTHWDKHLPTMYQFWNMVLLSKPGYEGYPTKKHMDVDKRIPLHQEHFDRWILLWDETVDAHFKGTNATHAKEKAKLMAELIMIKIDDSRTGNVIQ
jgi:hemoglobin